MQYKPHSITLSATVNNWRLFTLRRADPAFLSFQKKIHQRDNFTCQFCGFQAMDLLETINIDGNYVKNKANNLITACGFCTQCFFLEAVGKSDFGGGALIYLPEIPQVDLNALCHAIFADIFFQTKNATEAKNIYRSLKLRAQLVEEKLGEGLSNPAVFGQMIIDSQVNRPDSSDSLIHGALRLLPSISRFSLEIVSWSLASVNSLQT